MSYYISQRLEGEIVSNRIQGEIKGSLGQIMKRSERGQLGWEIY